METVFRKQVGKTACGLCSLAMVIDDARLARGNAAEKALPRTSEEAVAALQAGPAPVPLAKVGESGMTLPELSRMANHASIPHLVHYADQFASKKALLRALARLQGQGRRIVLNYHMAMAGQPPFGGHFSPLLGMADSKVGVLDCWYLTPEDKVWLDEDAVWAAMQAVDEESGRARGFLSFAASATLQGLRAPRPELQGKLFVLRPTGALAESLLHRIRECVNESFRGKSIFTNEEYYERVSVEALRGMLERGEIIVLAQAARHPETAEDVERILGVVQCCLDVAADGRPLGAINMLCVAAEVAGRGLSSLLFDAAEVRLIQQDVAVLELCFTEEERDMPNYGQLYLRKGYTVVRSEPSPAFFTDRLRPELKAKGPSFFHYCQVDLDQL